MVEFNQDLNSWELYPGVVYSNINKIYQPFVSRKIFPTDRVSWAVLQFHVQQILVSPSSSWNFRIQDFLTQWVYS